MGVILLPVPGSLMLAVPGSPLYKKPVLGLDLRGGLEVVLRAVPGKNHKLTPDDLTKSISIMQSRISGLGVSGRDTRKQGKDQIVIQLAGVHDPAAAARLIGKTAQLMLFDFEHDVTGPSVDEKGNAIPQPSLYVLLKQVQARADKGSPEAYYLFHTKTSTTKATKKGAKPTTTVTHSVDQGSPAATLAVLLKPFGGKVPPKAEVLRVAAHTIVVRRPAAQGG